MGIYDWLKLLSITGDVIITMKFVTSAIMCVYGYKWSKGLIATLSMYIGFALGILVTYVLIEAGAGWESLIAIPIVMSWFNGAAYQSLVLNHFLAGFLATVKIWNLIILFLAQGGMHIDSIMFFVVPSFLGIICGIIGCTYLNNYVILVCISFIGATEFVSGLVDIINKSFFVFTGDVGYIFSSDLEDIMLSFLGIEIPSMGEILLILVVFTLSFLYQKNMVEKNNIDLTRVGLDDRDDKIKLFKK